MSAFLWGMTANSDSPLVILVVAAVFFSGDCGTSESGGRGGISDCGLLQGVVFVIGCVGMHGVLLVSLNSYTMAGFDVVVCLFFVLGCTGSVGVCFVPSCVIIISSESSISCLCS